MLAAQPAQQAQLADVAGAAAAAAVDSADPQLQAAAQRVAACLAWRTQRQLEECSSGTGMAQQALLSGMAALQQLLLAAPAMAASPDVAAALHQLQGAADASMAGLMQAMQAPGEQQAGGQAVFQQLCQLRARLMLAFAGAAGAADAAAAGDAAGDAAAVEGKGSAAAGGLHVVADADQATAQAWRSVMLMPPDVAAAAAAAASAAVRSGTRHPSRPQFLAAWVAATSYLQASVAAAWSSCGGSSSGGGSTSGEEGSSTVHAGAQATCATEIPALPGVRFQPPPPLAAAAAAAGRDSGATGLAAAAEAAAVEVAQDPDCLGPVHLTLTALQLAQQMAASAQGAAGSPAIAGATDAAWPLLLELASAAAAMPAEPLQQRQLLLLLLHSQQAWLCRLRAALGANAELQRRCRRELVAVSNRLASGQTGWLYRLLVH